MRAGGQNFLFREFPDWWYDAVEDKDTAKIASNATFDLMWMIDDADKRGRVLAQPRNFRDPMLKGQLVHTYRTKTGAAKAGNPGAWQPNDLASLLEEFCGVQIKKAVDHDATYWPGPWSRKMKEYMLEDIIYLEEVDDILDDEVRSQGQERAAWIEQDVLCGTSWMTWNGITPDVESWRTSIEEWRDHYSHLITKHLRREFPTVQNFNSVQQLQRAMPDILGGAIPNTRKATLKQLAPHFPAIEMLLESRLYQTRLKNWGPKYLQEYVCGTCFRFHPSWRQIGTETARYSCSSPNLQQIPRAPEFRKLFVASPGCVLASLDYSAIEVLTAAIFANDRNLIAACATGDPHSAVARMTLGLSEEAWNALPAEERKKHRQNAKIVNFGLLFGGGAEGLVVQARDLFDTIISVGEARILIQRFYRLFPGLKRTRNLAYEAMNTPGRKVEVINGVGFRRLLERNNFKPTSWLNSWIQSTAGYGLKSSFAYLREAMLLPFLCAQVHDELIFEFPEEYADELVDSARECLVAGMRDVLGLQAPVNVDAAVGKVWL